MTTIERPIPANRVWIWKYESREDNDIWDTGKVFRSRANCVEELIEVLYDMLQEDFAYDPPTNWDVWAFCGMADEMRVHTETYAEFFWQQHWLDIFIIPTEIHD